MLETASKKYYAKQFYLFKWLEAAKIRFICSCQILSKRILSLKEIPTILDLFIMNWSKKFCLKKLVLAVHRLVMFSASAKVCHMIANYFFAVHSHSLIFMVSYLRHCKLHKLPTVHYYLFLCLTLPYKYTPFYIWNKKWFWFKHSNLIYSTKSSFGTAIRPKNIFTQVYTIYFSAIFLFILQKLTKNEWKLIPLLSFRVLHYIMCNF